jgi:tripeptide aminopeptidase
LQAEFLENIFRLLMSQSLLSRFLRYVQVDTQANDRSQTCPSTPGQLELAQMLQKELVTLGAADARVTEHGYVLATIPATSKNTAAPKLAFLAHMDTALEASGKNVKPVVHRNYDGSAITFADNPELVLDSSVSPELLQCKGKDIVTASGKTLLGADDKAGVAVIMTLAEGLLNNPSAGHGPIRICFTPDEEIGRGVDKLNLRELDAEVAYTLDGSTPGQICWETFSADGAVVTIEGVATHTAEAKAKGMVNAGVLAGRLLAMLPRERCAPETTSDREGFIHPKRIEGANKSATVEFLLRDFELPGLEQKGAILTELCNALQTAEPRAKIQCRIDKQYRNMAYWLRKDMRPVDLAREAMTAVGLNPVDFAIRGGTDGSRLTEMGLPTPNLFCGEHNAHGLMEWVAVQDMELAVKVCEQLAGLWADHGAYR